MRALIVRHYKTEFNATGAILGWGDAPRFKDWRADVDYVNNRLGKNKIRFDAVYSSDLERSRQTALFHAEALGAPNIYHNSAINEVNYGALFKKKKKWVTDNYPLHKMDPDFVYPEGESFRQMQERSTDFIASLIQKYPQETLLIVVHAGVIRGLVCHYLELDYAENLKRKISHRYIGDFQFEGDRCVGYNELGRNSGFLSDEAIEVPWSRPATILEFNPEATPPAAELPLPSSKTP